MKSHPDNAGQQPCAFYDPHGGRKEGRVFFMLRSVVALIVVLSNVWAVTALVVDHPIAWLGLTWALVLLGVWIAMVWRCKCQWSTLILGAGCFFVVLGWWLMLRPSANRNWQADVAKLPAVRFNNQDVIISGIRSCEYRSEFDYDVHFQEQSYRLADVRSADLFLVNWGSPLIAHTMLSFGFSDDRYLCFSIEARREVGENYSSLKGLFRQYEIMYVVANEQDLIGLRTHHRDGENVFLYSLNLNKTEITEMFLSYLERICQLHEAPEWYNAVSGNCTTAIRTQRSPDQRLAWDWRILFNGHLDELLYERGLIDTSLSFAELKRGALINIKAKVGSDQDFSQRIRQTSQSNQP